MNCVCLRTSQIWIVLLNTKHNKVMMFVPPLWGSTGRPTLRVVRRISRR